MIHPATVRYQLVEQEWGLHGSRHSRNVDASCAAVGALGLNIMYSKWSATLG